MSGPAGREWRIRYNSRLDRFLAFLIPSRRRHLRMAQTVLDELQPSRRVDPFLSDALLYGSAYVLADGLVRVPPSAITPEIEANHS